MKTINDARPLTPSRYSVEDFFGSSVWVCFSLPLLLIGPGTDRMKLGMENKSNCNKGIRIDLCMRPRLAEGMGVKPGLLEVNESGEVRRTSSSLLCALSLNHIVLI
jgi:hypothetical protein